MRLCVFEDARVEQLDPLTLVRPAFDLWCGVSSLLERHCRYFGATEVGFVVRPSLAGWWRFLHPCHPVNDADWLGSESVVLVNARWLPPDGRSSVTLNAPLVDCCERQVAYVVVPASDRGAVQPERFLTWVELLRQTSPSAQAGGAMIDYPWDLVRHNAETLAQDLTRFRAGSTEPTSDSSPIILGSSDRLFIDPRATLETPVVVDTRNGPVILDRGALVRAFSRIEGPCYVGPGSQILGASIKGSTIGPECRIGGEVEGSILQGYTNKYHDGFLGHSYVGEWVNLAAGTQVSDLRNDYGTIRVRLDDEEVDTGLMKVGAFLGDHVRTGVGTLLNCGTMAGAFAQLLPCGSYLPRTIPSFCTVWQGKIKERARFRHLFTAAATAMSRRGQVWKAEHSDFFLSLYEATAADRHDVLYLGPESRQESMRNGARLGARRCF